MVEVSASILDINEEEAIKTLYNLEISNIDYFHVDVMDGNFVENNTIDKMNKYSNYIKQISTLPIEVHLMVDNVKKYIDEYSGVEPRTVIFHYESIENKNEIMDIIKYIKDLGINVGISIKPETKVEEIYEYLPYIHLVLVMTVEPGKGGQKLIESTVDKIVDLKKYITEKNIDIAIEVDGGINLENSKMLKDSGVDIFVAGSLILKSDSYKETINKLKSNT